MLHFVYEINTSYSHTYPNFEMTLNYISVAVVAWLVP